MNSLKTMEIQRLLKELDFLESDFMYKNEVIKSSDVEFEKNVNDVVEANSELKKIWDHLNNKKQEINNFEINLQIDDKINIDDRVKKVFREIAKQTHPDKVQNRKLNEIYINAKKAHDENDLIKLYTICYDLLIEIEIRDNEIEELHRKIKNLKERISLIESTYTNKWIKSNDEEKNMIIYEFIKNRLSQY